MADEKAGRGDPRSVAPAHVLTLTNREQLQVAGVVAVESFDDQEIVLQTELGMLTVRGEELHIKQLDLESGRFAVDGLVHSLVYTSRPGRGPGRGRGLLDRLLR